MPAVSGYRVLPEKLLRSFAALSLDVVTHNPDGLRVGCVMVAVGPVAGIQNVIFAENIPEGVERVFGKRCTALLLDAGSDYFRELDEDVFVPRQVPQQ